MESLTRLVNSLPQRNKMKSIVLCVWGRVAVWILSQVCDTVFLLQKGTRSGELCCVFGERLHLASVSRSGELCCVFGERLHLASV